MQLSAYLDRIGFSGTPRPDLASLKALHRAHHLAVPYDALDVQLEREVSTDPAHAYRKIVEQRRGGWCYEMNGVFGWALGEIGFDVTRVAAGANKEVGGELLLGNHLILLVRLPESLYLADVGFGDGPVEPYPIVEGPFSQNGFHFALERPEGDWWRLRNRQGGGAKSFDFKLDGADEALMAGRCEWLRFSPESAFVLNAVVQRHTPEGYLLLRGRTLITVTPQGETSRLLADADEYVGVLRETFGLDLPEAASLWPRICARHEQVMAERLEKAEA
ncbi:MAG TPA: arylamine N-acetyltransferase [Phenylobacterium sp.]|nr:arylamine N-acetyltransferase [Phenylobacterium sp.]